MLAHGTALSCKDPERCRRCYLDMLCGQLDRTIEGLQERTFETFRADKPVKMPYEDAKRAWAVAKDVTEAAKIAASLPGDELVLECEDYSGLTVDLVNGVETALVSGKKVVRAEAKSPAAIDQLLALGGSFEIAVHLTQATAAHLFEHYNPAPARLAFTVSNYELVTANWENDIFLPAFFGSYDAAGAVREGIPACQGGKTPRRRPSVFDSRMLGTDGKLDIFGYAHRYIEESYYTKSRRCRDCVHDLECEGVHINFVRSHGYAPLMPVLPEGEEAGPIAATA